MEDQKEVARLQDLKLRAFSIAANTSGKDSFNQNDRHSVESLIRAADKIYESIIKTK